MRFKGYLMDLHGHCERLPIDMTHAHFLNVQRTESDRFLAEIQHEYEDMHQIQK